MVLGSRKEGSADQGPRGSGGTQTSGSKGEDAAGSEREGDTNQPWIQSGNLVQAGSEQSEGSPGCLWESGLGWGPEAYSRGAPGPTGVAKGIPGGSGLLIRAPSRNGVSRGIPGDCGPGWGSERRRGGLWAGLGSPGGLWAGLGSQGATQGGLGQTGAPRGDLGGSGPDWGLKGRLRDVWAGLRFPGGPWGRVWSGLGSQGASQGDLGRTRAARGVPGAPGRAGVAVGEGRPRPTARPGSGGRARTKRGGRGRGGRDRGGRAGGRREGRRGPGGRRGLRWGGAAAPHLIVHGWRPAPPPGPASLAAVPAAAAAQRRPAALIVCQAPPPPLPAARPPASPAEPETAASSGRAPTPGPRRRLGPAAPTDSRLAQSAARTAARGAGLPAWRGPAGLRSEGRSPQPMGGPDRRGGRREGGRREASPAEGSARCAPHVEGGGGGTGAPRLRTAARRGRCLVAGASQSRSSGRGFEPRGGSPRDTFVSGRMSLLYDGMSPALWNCRLIFQSWVCLVASMVNSLLSLSLSLPSVKWGQSQSGVMLVYAHLNDANLKSVTLE